MAYFKIDNVDYSKYVSALSVKKTNVYNAQTNAAGNTIADYINTKRNIEVEIIALNDVVMQQIQEAIDAFNVTISFRNPKTNALEDINCIIPGDSVDYYTIQADKVLYKAFKLTFNEL